SGFGGANPGARPAPMDETKSGAGALFWLDSPSLLPTSEACHARPVACPHPPAHEPDPGTPPRPRGRPCRREDPEPVEGPGVEDAAHPPLRRGGPAERRAADLVGGRPRHPAHPLSPAGHPGLPAVSPCAAPHA